MGIFMNTNDLNINLSPKQAEHKEITVYDLNDQECMYGRRDFKSTLDQNYTGF